MTDHATKAKAMLDEYLTWGGFGRVEREAMVWPGRRFRADWYLPDQGVVVEYDGLTAPTAFNRHGDESNVGHRAVAQIMRDAEKSNLAQREGYKFYRFNAKTVYNGEAFSFLDQALVKIEEE